ncbi:MAG: tRNA (N6-threonylcarbamoyladenosine(37)-N6)-methyltransferase TrmO [Candidatus Geothermincolia bacterium]
MDTAGFRFEPIGYVESDFKESGQDPDSFRGSVSRVRLLPEFAEGLFRIEGYELLYIIYVFDRAEGFKLVIHPRGDPQRPERGVFATHSPYRPNPIGLTVVELLEVGDRVLTVRDLDAIDGTPVLDIKPCNH